MSSRLTIHIGQGKTGSSFIQATCALNRSRLIRDFGILYPSVPHDPFGYDPTHHEFFFRNPNYLSLGQVQDYLRSSFELCERHSGNHVLLSWENFEDELWIDQLHQALREFDVDLGILVYLRRQDSWIESAWKQWNNKLPSDPDIAEYAAAANCDWYAWLERWAARFGRERIQVRPYEKAQLPKGLLADFFEAIGYPAATVDALERPPATNAVANRGFRPSVMEVLSLSKELNRGTHDNRLFDAFTELLSEPFKKPEFEPYGLLTPAQRIEIFERFEPSNRRIAIEYLNRVDGRLFYDPWPDAADSPAEVPGLTLERLVPVLVDMIVGLNDRVRAVENRAAPAANGASSVPAIEPARQGSSAAAVLAPLPTGERSEESSRSSTPTVAATADGAAKGSDVKLPILPLEEVFQESKSDWWRFFPTEFLLPQIKKHIELREFPYIENRKPNPKWSHEAIAEKIRELGHWEYFFPFEGDQTTREFCTFKDRTIEFHRYRSDLISATVVDLLGDAAGASTVLDLACHCGAFTMDLATRGVREAHGIEFREKNLRQARFLREYYDIPNASFEQGDVYEIPDRSYDVVMCLGLLYHVVRPVDVVEYCFRNARKFAVIETVCHKQPVSGYVVIGDKDVNVAIEGTRSIEFQPTYRGLIDTMKQVGFKNIVEVVGTCDTKIELFSDNTRRCLIGFK